MDIRSFSVSTSILIMVYTTLTERILSFNIEKLFHLLTVADEIELSTIINISSDKHQIS